MRRRHHNARHHLRRRNPFTPRGLIASIIDGVTVGAGAFGGYAAVKNLDALYSLPFLQTTNVPGTTATVGDTLQSVADATAVTLVAHFAMRKGGRRMAQFFGGAIAGAWLSVIHDLLASWTSAPAFISSSLSGYPRMGAIAPGATYLPALSAGPVFNPNARMAGYPVIAPGRGF